MASRVTPARPQPITPRIAPWVRYIIDEVASSPPATTTIVRATPKTVPWISGAHGEAAATSGPPAVTMMTTPIPMYAPASIVWTRKVHGTPSMLLLVVAARAW